MFFLIAPVSSGRLFTGAIQGLDEPHLDIMMSFYQDEFI
jgi:hypothetical protein